jgi:hypothetical protein
MWGAEGEILVANGRTLTNICANWPRRGGFTNQRKYCLYSALPDVYGPLHLIPKAQRTSLKSWRVGKIIENGFKRMNIRKLNLSSSPSNLYYFFPVISHFDGVLIVFQKNKKNQNQ